MEAIGDEFVEIRDQRSETQSSEINVSPSPRLRSGEAGLSAAENTIEGRAARPRAVTASIRMNGSSYRPRAVDAAAFVEFVDGLRASAGFGAQNPLSSYNPLPWKGCFKDSEYTPKIKSLTSKAPGYYTPSPPFESIQPLPPLKEFKPP